jgi:hypothetical protein
MQNRPINIPTEAIQVLIQAVQSMPWHAADPILRRYNELMAQANPQSEVPEDAA